MLGRLFQLLSDQKPSQSPRESLLPLCWPPGPPRDTSAACRRLMILWILSMGVGHKEQWPSGYPPCAMSDVLNLVSTPQVSEHTAPTFQPQAMLNRGLDLPLTPPPQPACIHLQLSSHMYPGLPSSHSVLPRQATGELG